MDNGYHIQGRSAVKGTLHCEQIVHLYDLLHKLGGPKGIIRQCEFSFTVTGTNRLSTNVWREDTNILRLQAG